MAATEWFCLMPMWLGGPWLPWKMRRTRQPPMRRQGGRLGQRIADRSRIAAAARVLLQHVGDQVPGHRTPAVALERLDRHECAIATAFGATKPNPFVSFQSVMRPT